MASGCYVCELRALEVEEANSGAPEFRVVLIDRDALWRECESLDNEAGVLFDSFHAWCPRCSQVRCSVQKVGTFGERIAGMREHLDQLRACREFGLI